MLVRIENPSDIDAIRLLNYSVFKDHPHHEPGAEPTEHLIVDRLRDENGLTLSLVSEDKSLIVGHIAVSPVVIGKKSNDWFGLGPVAVLPSEQNKGIGSKLVQAAIEELRQRKAEGIVVMGEPDFYGRFGFKQSESITYPGIPSEYFMVLLFKNAVASGHVSYHPAFSEN
ncbi:N-acetyltransferase [Candidatus Sororendozoicomonas aggregata]|uniref:GNAT family N-acetyltransferase n=1 Tax=Candidatus Sororendozoicomonas aggregata TaxID=3073239 RepID=UPI002ED034CB